LTLASDSQGGTLSRNYDGDNLAGVTYQGGSYAAVAQMAYDSAGELTAIARLAAPGAGTPVADTTLSYQGGQASSIGPTAAGPPLSFGYSYDPSGQLTQLADGGSTTAFNYDAAGQLTAAGTQGYSYDPNGNLAGAGVSVGANNEILSDGTWTYSYSPG